MKVKEFEEKIAGYGFERKHRNSPIGDKDYINLKTLKEIAIINEGGFVKTIIALDVKTKDVSSYDIAHQDDFWKKMDS